jgi:hypothetical protein
MARLKLRQAYFAEAATATFEFRLMPASVGVGDPLEAIGNTGAHSQREPGTRLTLTLGSK